MNYLQQIQQTTDFLKAQGITQPTVGIVLGTGLGQMVNHIKAIHTISYADIPSFPVATVEYHSGKLIYGTLNGKYVLAMQGRFHFYEGYSMQQITFGIRVMHALGVKNLLLSNAAGGINLDYKKGELVLLNDHINLQPENPLRGLNDPAYGTRFPDMSCPYDKHMSSLFKTKAQGLNLTLHSGVYCSVMGPNLETRAEYRFLKTIGADVVGMSTVPEVIVANQIGLPCAAVSVVTDECNPDNLHPVTLEEIVAIANTADEKLSNLFAAVIGDL